MSDLQKIRRSLIRLWADAIRRRQYVLAAVYGVAALDISVEVLNAGGTLDG